MSDYLCHDFKTPRTDTARRLPSTFRFIPIMFYVALVGGLYVMTMDYFTYKRSQREKAEAEAQQKTIEGERDGFKSELGKLEVDAAKGEVVARWMEGARNMQPIAVRIARAVRQDTRLGELSLARSDEVPSNITLAMRVTGDKSSSEITAIEGAIAQLQYRSYSPQQSKNEATGSIDYKSTLVRSAQ